MYALVLVVVSVIRTGGCVSAKKIHHFILIQRYVAYVCVKLLVLIVKFACFAIFG